MWKAHRRRARLSAATVLAVVSMLIASSLIAAADGTGKSSERKLKEAGEGIFEVLEAAEQYAEARTAPAGLVDPGAFSGAYLEAKNLPTVGGPWTGSPRGWSRAVSTTSTRPGSRRGSRPARRGC